jgi:putative solute:sodium symporter small subunit
VSRPERITVMSQSTRQARLSGRPSVGPPPRDTTGPHDAARLAVLMRVHRRLALQTMAILVVGLFGLALLLASLPDLTSTRVLGVPVIWWVLGFGVYPWLLLLGHWHARRAERVDDELS